MTGGTALQSDPIEKLAETLYWKLEHLDPTFGEFGWENLEEDTREIYRICIRYLGDYAEVDGLKRAFFCFILVLTFSCQIVTTADGRGLGPTYSSAHGGETMPPYAVSIIDGGISPSTKSIPAIWSACCAILDTGWAGPRRVGSLISNTNGPAYWQALSWTPQWASLKPSAIAWARFWDSGSFIRWKMMIDSLVAVPRWSRIADTWKFSRPRQANSDFSRSVSSWACAARSTASVSLSFDRRVSSFWRRDSIMLNMTSPPTPSATSMSAMTGVHIPSAESFEGRTIAAATSIMRPNKTSSPLLMTHVSQDDEARSMSSSLAFLIPFGRRHAGNGVPFWWFWLVVSAGILTVPLLIWLNGVFK